VELAVLIVAVVIVALVAAMVTRTVRIVPQARARNVERFGRYRKTLEPGMNFIIPFVDRVKPSIDLREQVVAFKGQPVITEDNLVVHIDTVLFFQVTDPRAADYEIVNYIQAIEQITATMLRSVIGNMDLEETLTSRDKINTMLRGVLDDASGKWGLRVTRVEIKAIDPPKSVIDAMEKQMRAEREKRAAILTAEGVRQSKILTAEGEKQSQILRAEGDRQGQILRSEGQAQAIGTVFQAVHDGDASPQVLAYQYLQTLPQLAQAEGNTFWVIPSEVTTALRTLSTAFGSSAEDAGAPGSAGAPGGKAGPPAGRVQMPGPAAALTGDGGPARQVPNGAAARAAAAAGARDEVLQVEREVAALEREAADAERGTGRAVRRNPGSQPATSEPDREPDGQ
jgi:regulator of protease activity HflC (stomatin/prohibitin superfamily)